MFPFICRDKINFVFNIERKRFESKFSVYCGKVYVFNSKSKVSVKRQNIRLKLPFDKCRIFLNSLRHAVDHLITWA